MFDQEENVATLDRNPLLYQHETQNLDAEYVDVNEPDQVIFLPGADEDACLAAEMAMHREAFFSVAFDITDFVTQEKLRDLDREHFRFLDTDPMASQEAIDANFSVAAYEKLTPVELVKRLQEAKKHEDRRWRCMGFKNKFLKDVLKIGQGVRNFFISQCDFFKPQRRGEFLLCSNGLWLDLDLHRAGCVLKPWINNEPFIVKSILAKCADIGAPLPSLIFRSGRGYYVKWLTDRMPRGAFPRVRAVMNQLVEAFDDFGADNVSDSSRIMRMAGSINPKAGIGATAATTVRLIHNRVDLEYKFEDLAKKLLPVERTPEQMAKWALQREIKAKEGKRQAKSSALRARWDEVEEKVKKRQAESLAMRAAWIAKNPAGSRKPLPGVDAPKTKEQAIWAKRDKDFEKLMKSCTTEGRRELLLFYRLNAGLWLKTVTAENFWDKADEFLKDIPFQVDIAKPKAKFMNLYNRAVELRDGQTRKRKDAFGIEREVPPLYFYSNEQLIAKLGITDEESEGMKSLLTPSEQARRKRERRAKERANKAESRRTQGMKQRDTYVAERADRGARALQLRSSGMTHAQVGAELGISGDAARKLCNRAAAKSAPTPSRVNVVDLSADTSGGTVCPWGGADGLLPPNWAERDAVPRIRDPKLTDRLLPFFTEIGSYGDQIPKYLGNLKDQGFYAGQLQSILGNLKDQGFLAAQEAIAMAMRRGPDFGAAGALVEKPP